MMFIRNMYIVKFHYSIKQESLKQTGNFNTVRNNNKWDVFMNKNSSKTFT